MKKLIHYLLTAIIGFLGFSCKTTQKAIDQADQKKIIEEPVYKLMYGVPPVHYEIKDTDIKKE